MTPHRHASGPTLLALPWLLALLPLLGSLFALAMAGDLHTTGLIEEWSYFAAFDRGKSMAEVMAGQWNRPLLLLPYKLAYLLTPGSFVALNIMHGALLVAKGLLFYAIVRRVLDDGPALTAAVVAGVLFAVYPADQGSFNARYLSYQVSVVAYLCAVLALLRYMERPGLGWIVAIQASLAGCLGTYEVAIPLVLLTPVFVAFLPQRGSIPWRRIVLIWYPMPMLAIAGLIGVAVGGGTYVRGLLDMPGQADVPRWPAYAEGLQRAYKRVLFGGWSEAWRAVAHDIVWTPRTIVAMAVPLVTAMGAYLIAGRTPSNVGEQTPRSRLLMLILLGAVIVGAGFAPFLPTPLRNTFERTLTFASIGGVLVTVIAAWAVLGRRPSTRLVFVAVACGATFLATSEAFVQRAEVARYSLKEQRILSALAQQVPVLPRDVPLLVLDPLRQFPKTDKMFAAATGHFRDAVGFLYHSDAARVYLCYPEGETLGTYYEGCRFEPDGIVILSHAQPVLRYGYDRIVALQYTRRGALELLQQLPAAYVPANSRAGEYDPRRHIQAGEPPRRVQTLFAEWPVPAPATSEAPREALRVDFDRAFDGHGWWMPEGSLMWMVDTTADIETRLASGRDYEVSFRISMAITPDVLDSLRFEVNDAPVTLSATRDPQGAVILRGHVPASAVGRDAERTTLRFRVDRLVTPQSLGMNQDKRTLALLFDWLRVEPAGAH